MKFSSVVSALALAAEPECRGSLWRTHVLTVEEHLDHAEQNKSVDGDDDVSVYDYQDAQVFSTIDPPEQSFYVIYDTGMNNLWSDEQKPGFWPWSSEHPAYDLSKLSIYVADGTKFNIRYGGGLLFGYYSEDTVQVGNVALEQYTFAEVDNTKGLGPSGSARKFDGIRGLGWDDTSVIGVTTPLRAEMKPKQVPKNVLGFYLGSQGSDTELLVGDEDPKHYVGDFTYVPVIETVPGKYGYWTFAMEDIMIDDASMTSVRKTIVDSSKSLLAGLHPSHLRAFGSYSNTDA